ncbi:hypothetical protein [Pseudophaeobacter sp.]|uniref:hypothetical protein n=1 Tax=Pseudophaeobacter sp. TaxID=1971739 RepID=UPI004058519B
MIIWLVGITGSLAGSACIKERADADKKLRYCSINLSLWISPGDRNERSGIYLERAVTLMKLERMNEAKNDLRRAMQDAKDGSEERIITRLQLDSAQRLDFERWIKDD